MSAHRKLILALVAKVRAAQEEMDSLQSDITDLNEALYTQRDAASRTAARLREEIDNERYEAQRRADEESYRSHERNRVIRELERARTYGDSYAVEVAARKLRRLT